ncbi:MAG: 50S ribosomal protein L18 [Endomicrobia bacterium]|nr:50S ribosomal protein L18 [Endomicrobiia bacterium]
MNKNETIQPKIRLYKRKFNIRKEVFGTKEKPRLSVYKSLKHIYAQAIDDEKGNTIVGYSTLTKDIREKIIGKTKTEQAKVVGETIGKKLLELGINKIVFDRNGRKYIGRIKALADGIRSVGIKF